MMVLDRESITDIKKKMIILSNRMPFSADTKRYFAEIERHDWLKANIKISGSSLTDNQIELIAGGEICLSVPVSEHVRAKRISDLLESMYGFYQMDRSLDLNLIDCMHRMISGSETRRDYRKKSVILRELEYAPPIPAEIPQRMQQFASELIGTEAVNNFGEKVFENAAMIHNRIVEIYPYNERNKLLARAASSYYLMSRGFPAVTVNLKEQEYNEAIVKYLKKGDCYEMAGAWMEAVYRRLRLMIQLTGY